jgi:hypothetical protein
MAEFDAAGFSAIDQFFSGGGGGVAANQGKTVGATTHNDRTNLISKGNRRGVGSAVPVSTKPSDWTRKVLVAGRKRQRDDDDHEDVDDATVDGEDNDDDEGGRTGIAAAANATKMNTNTTISSEPKKKLGKKERKRLQANEESSQHDGSAKENPETTEIGDEETAPGEELSRKKQKRRKIRSKQKNIRKDHREEKPVHLLVGRRNYNGRPLTAETRAKLNLPAPKTRTPVYGIDQSHDEDRGEVTAGRLAIDDLLEPDVETEMEPPKSGRTNVMTKKKNKKPKYKNLKV